MLQVAISICVHPCPEIENTNLEERIDKAV